MADLTQTRMTVPDFLKLPEGKFICELINGTRQVNLAKDPHQTVVGNAYFLVRQLAKSGKVRVLRTGVYFDEYNFVQPDVFFVSDTNTRCTLGEDGYWHGAPDLIVEVLSRRTSLGLLATGHGVLAQKFNLYERYGVREFWLIMPTSSQVMEVQILDGNELIQQGLYTPGDTFTSPVLDGQAIDVKALFES